MKPYAGIATCCTCKVCGRAKEEHTSAKKTNRQAAKKEIKRQLED